MDKYLLDVVIFNYLSILFAAFGKKYPCTLILGIPFNTINCDEFDQVLEAAGRFGPGAKKLLHEEVEDTKKIVKDQAEEWKRTGCSLMTDAWTDQKRRSIMNLCINCCIGTSFVQSKEVLAESHTGEFIFEFVDNFIEKFGDGKKHNCASGHGQCCKQYGSKGYALCQETQSILDFMCNPHYKPSA
jgi:hypothetical protein